MWVLVDCFGLPFVMRGSGVIYMVAVELFCLCCGSGVAYMGSLLRVCWFGFACCRLWVGVIVVYLFIGCCGVVYCCGLVLL